MKMRRKLAALLATVMLVSVMPMTAFAISSNDVTKAVTVKEDEKLGANAPKLKIELKDELSDGDVFTLKLNNAEVQKDEDADDIQAGITGSTSGGALEITRDGKKTLNVEARKNIEKGTFYIPLDKIVATGGDATIEVLSNGTEVSNSGPHLFAKTGKSDNKATVKVKDAKTYVTDHTDIRAAEITITENYPGAMKSGERITITLDDKDFKFAKDSKTKMDGNFAVNDVDESGFNIVGNTVTITIPNNDDTRRQIGEYKIEDLIVTAPRRASLGDVTASVKADFLEDDVNVTLAKLSDLSTNLKTDKVEEFTAGNKETVKFTLEEARGTLVNRSASFIFSEGIEIVSVKKAGEYKKDTSKFEIIDKGKKDKEQNELVINNIAGALDKEKAKFEIELNIPLNFKGDLMVKTDSRAFDNSELKLADVKPRVEVKVDPIHVKAGTKTTMGGKITLTETEKGNIERGDLVIQLDEDDRYYNDLEFMNVKDLDIKTTGGIKVDEAEYVNRSTSGAAIKMRVSRPATGDEAGTIEISGFEIKSRYTIVDGAYDIEIGGDALTDIKELQKKKQDTMTVKDFLVVGDMARKAVFTIGETEFTVNGKVMNMDAAAYIKDGRTMVPLRYLSYALGIDEEDIKFNSGVVTIFAKDGKVIQVRNGDNNLTVNGMNIPMVTAAEIVEGRTYVPVTEIGGVFGVTGTWDPVAQTATFQ